MDSQNTDATSHHVDTGVKLETGGTCETFETCETCEETCKHSINLQSET